MRLPRETSTLVVGAGLLALLPVLGSLAWSYQQAIDRGKAQIEEVSRSVAAQVHDVLWTAEGALADVAFAARNGCTQALILEFRNKSSAFGLMRGMGYVASDGQLGCTSTGKLDPPIPVESTPLIKPADSVVWFTRPLETAMTPGPAIIAMHQVRSGGWVNVLFPPDLLIDTVATESIVPKGFIGVTMAGVPLVESGRSDLGSEPVLETTIPVNLFETVVTVKMPRSWALATWEDDLLISGGIGAVVVLLIIAAAVRLAHRRTPLSEELEEALARREFEVYYQPVIDLANGRCTGAEALIRWRRSKEGMIPPDRFMGCAEDTGLVIPMTRWLMQQVTVEMGAALRADHRLHIAVNLSAAHFQSLEVIDDVRRIFGDAGIQLTQIVFEITERGMVDTDGCREVVEQLDEGGSGVAIDDFGTGYCSLSYIQKFRRLRYLKIDKAFVTSIGKDAISSRLALDIIRMAHSLGLRLIAEGVETVEQEAYLKQHGVHLAQGYLFSRPLPADAFLGYVAERNGDEHADAALSAGRPRHLAVAGKPD